MGQGASTERTQASLATSGEYEIVTVAFFLLVKTNGFGSRWAVKHMVTNELVRPLAIPGGNDVVGDEDSLYRDHHTTALVEGQQCTYCNAMALGATTYPQDLVPWNKWADQISHLDPSPVKWGPPYVDIVLKEVDPRGPNVNPYGDSLAERMLLSEKLKYMGFYRPTRSYIGIPTCSQMACQRKAGQDIKAFFKDSGFGPELPLSLQPLTTPLGNPVCQVCGSEEIKMCKKEDRYCGFGYCGRAHQETDWLNHKEACKYHRKRNKPIANMKPLVCHIFTGDPEKKLKYWYATNSVDARILDITSKYNFDHFPAFTRVLDDTQHSSLEGTETEPLQCAICLRRAAIKTGSFHSLPVTDDDDDDSDQLKYYESMLRHYSEVGAFQGKPFVDTWALFNDLRSSMAQMAALYIPVCDQRACLKKTTVMFEKSTKQIFDNDGQPLKPVRVMTQIYP